MDKRIILAVAGSGKTYKLGHDIDETKRNIVLAYTNQNIKNIRKEIIDKYGKIPKNTLVLTFDSFLYRYFIRPYEKIILKFWNKSKVKMNGVEINIKPEPRFKNRKPNFKYKKINEFEHYILKDKYYCSRIPELILYIKDENQNLFKMAMDNINKFCDYIYIDEVQDFREKYYELLESIIKECNNIVLVGDYYQHSTNGENNSGKPFNNCTYEQYVEKLKHLGLEVDAISLKKSRRCPKKICEFVKEKFKIDIDAIDENPDGEIVFLEEENEIDAILNDDSIIKLVYNNSKIYKFNSIGWGISKGDTFINTCIILTGEYSNIKSNSFSLPKSQISNNKLYVAFTRAKNIVYVISKNKFDLYREKYLK